MVMESTRLRVYLLSAKFVVVVHVVVFAKISNCLPDFRIELHI